MADSDDPKAEASAEKAYAAATEVIGEKSGAEAASPEPAAPPASPVVEPVEFPAKPKRAREADAVVAPVAAAPAPPAAAPAPKPRRPRAAAAKAVKPAKAATKPAAKRAAAKVAIGKATPAKAPRPAVQKIKAAPKAGPKTVSKTVKASPVKAAAAPKLPFIAQLKEIPMDVTTSIKDAVNGAQEKAKEAFSKTSAAATEYGEFAKGNVEAFVESGKILASGLQDLSSKFLADSKTAFETATSDVKALTSVKSPTDLFQLQSDLLRRNFDSAIAYSSKTSESLLKLTSDVIAPLSGRVNLAVEKIKKAA